METAVFVVVLVALVVLGIKSYMKKLASGCCGASAQKEERIRAKDMNEAHYPYTYRVSVEGMHCENCAVRLENAFHAQAGMWAEGDVAHACVMLRTTQPVEAGRIKQIVALAGYRATAISPFPANTKEQKSC